MVNMTDYCLVNNIQQHHAEVLVITSYVRMELRLQEAEDLIDRDAFLVVVVELFLEPTILT